MVYNKISVVVPTYNEEENIEQLIARIDAALTAKNITYEVIVVDDNSTDKTQQVIKSLQKNYPVKLFIKKSEKGKATSLLEGFSYASFELICMIDADLQYPPESIPEMVQRMHKADIVVGKRIYSHSSPLRSFFSRGFSFFFVRLLNGIQVDSQSGLKVFKKHIIERISPYLAPTSWTFDLDFLKKSLDAGYVIDSIDMPFEKRHAGKSKLNVVKASFEIGSHAVALRFAEPILIAFHPKHGVKNAKEGFHYQGLPFSSYVNHPLQKSALKQTTKSQVFFMLALVYLLSVSLMINAHMTIITALLLLNILYFTDLLFNLFLIYRSFAVTPELTVNKNAIARIPEKDWPTYTVFCPLYKEWNVVPQFIDAMSKLDYPKDKLQVMLLLEEDDKETIEKVKLFDLPTYFDIVVVPDAKPKTKPKALNYGMRHATGEYIVIYDAEDIPESDQLKKAVLAFKKSPATIACIQAKLNFYNPHQNILTRVFTAEYSLWFDLVLTGLQSINAPIPLGGTSNHFKKKILMKLDGWDAFNVTEDADLGLRLAKAGYRTAIMDSTTYEEANSDYINWFHQRMRWIKGYIQTYFVHARDLRSFRSSLREPHALTFQLIIGGKILSMLVNPLMWLLTVSYFAFTPYVGAAIESLFPPSVLYIAVFSLIIGNFLYLYYYMIGAAKRKQWHIIPFTIFIPLYWLAMSIATGLAVWEFLFKPHYWHKTKHGLHLQPEQGTKKVVVTGEVSPSFQQA
ncbi:MAG: glycosyltransferase [Patescibacteria group bacterium]